jgi:site-specific recombinase
LVVTGLLNVGVSFYMAFLLALRAHNVSGVQRGLIYVALRQRLRKRLLSFFWPEPESALPKSTRSNTDAEPAPAAAPAALANTRQAKTPNG